MFAGLRKKWRDQIGQTKTILGEKVREALASVVPITLIVLILCFTAAPVPTDVLLAFLVGAVLLIVGMGLFTLGADTAMLPIGERVGAQMTKSRKLWVVVCVSLLIGIIVTISEPDLQVLAGQVPGIPNAVLIGAVAVQEQALTDYPTLMRPLLLRNSRYNQHATTGSLLVEVGTAGNAPEEAELAARLFAAELAKTLEERSK